MHPLGFRKQVLGIQFTGEREIGFSGAWAKDHLWTSRTMVARCETGDAPLPYETFHEMPKSYTAKYPGIGSGLIRPDTVKMPERQSMVLDKHAAAAREHLLNNKCPVATAHGCGIYAFKQLSDMVTQPNYHPDVPFVDNHWTLQRWINVVTQVIGWGAVAEYQHGWRFQFCEPVGITLIAGTNDPERKVWMFQITPELGRFLRSGQERPDGSNGPFDVEVPLHFVMGLLSAKFQCPVNIVTDTAELVSGIAQ